jgi:hypothetical protein
VLDRMFGKHGTRRWMGLGNRDLVTEIEQLWPDIEPEVVCYREGDGWVAGSGSGGIGSDGLARRSERAEKTWRASSRRRGTAGC